MVKYSLETKLAAVYAYLDGTESFKVTAQKQRRYNDAEGMGSQLSKPWGESFPKNIYKLRC